MDSYKTNDFINIVDDDLTTKDLLRKIIDSGCVDEGFYICNIDTLIQHHLHFKKMLPNIEAFYAIKCNPDKMLVAVLAALGVSFDCASLVEMQQVLSLGVDPKKIVYALPTKPLSHIRYATKHNVNLMSFDHECELEKIKGINPNAELLLRIKADAEKAIVVFGKKFGCDAEVDASRILQQAHDMQMNVVGVCFNVGTSCEESDAFYKGIKKARLVFDAAKAIGFQMHILDIGGGFPYKNRESLDSIAVKVNEALSTYFPSEEFGHLRVIAEPGRYYCAPTLTIACQIHTVKKEILESNREHFLYYITDGIYGSFLFLGLDKGTIAPYTLQDHNKELYESTIYGPTCDSTDKIMSNYLLPKLSLNDWIICSNFGAYSVAAATSFNGFTRPQYVYVCGQTTAQYLFQIASIKHLFNESRMNVSSA